MKLLNFYCLLLFFLILSNKGHLLSVTAAPSDADYPSEILCCLSGVIDRFENHDQAVILIESLNKEIIVDKSRLPEGSLVHTWVNIELVDGTFVIHSIDNVKTKATTEQNRQLLERLREEMK